MGRRLRKPGFLTGALAFGIMLTLVLFVAIGCGEEEKDETTAKTATGTAVGVAKGKVWVASGIDAFTYSVIDLETKTIENVTVEGSLEPHGIIADLTETDVVANTRGRVMTETPETFYIGSSKDGKLHKVNAATGEVEKVIEPPAGAKIAVCGMQLGPDGMIWISSMGDGKAYPLDPETDTIGEGIGGGGVTTSICGLAWSEDEKFIYMSNMSNPADPAEPGYVAKLEFPGGTLVKKIEGVTEAQPGKVVAHQAEATPDGKFLYVTDSGAGTLVKIDLATDEVIGRFPIGGKEVHAIVFEPDGKTAYLSVRAVPDANQSSVFVYDVEKDVVTDQIPGIMAAKICGIILLPGS